MEKQREEYEQKAIKAIHRAENEKAEAQSKMEYLQVSLQMQWSKSPTLPPYLYLQTSSCVPIIQFSFPLFPFTRGRCRQHRQSLISGRGCVRNWKRVRVSWRGGRMSAQIRCYSCRVTWRYTKATVTETIMRVSMDLSDTSQIFAKADKPQDPALCTPHHNYTEMYWWGGACHLYMLCNWECVCAVFCGTGGDAEETYRISAAGESRASFLHLRAGGREPQPERTPTGTHRWGKTDFHFTFIQIFRMYGIYYTVKKLMSCIYFNSHFSCNLISFFIFILHTYRTQPWVVEQ